MKANKRMNLFAELTRSQAPKLELKKLRLSVHGYFSLIITTFYLIYGIPKYLGYNRDTKTVKVEIENIESQVVELVKVADARAEKVRAAKIAAAEARSKEVKQRKLAGLSSQMDGSWTAVLWKLVTFAEGIVVEKIELGGRTAVEKPEDSPDGKRVVLEGSASSLSTLTQWMEILSMNLPQSNFTVDRHSLGADKQFPVTFRLIARVL